MKLDREICKRCIDRHTTSKGEMWDWMDDEWWDERHTVICPTDLADDWPASFDDDARTNGWPPPHCPYAVEHIALYAAERQDNRNQSV